MPKTIIQISTFMCPTGLGNLDAPCRFHRHANNLPLDRKCPTCKLDLVQATDPLDKITMTVIGEEDIETEIEKIKERKTKGEHTKDDPDLSTKKKEDDHREKRQEDVRQAIEKTKEYEDN